jgi:diaminopropionate ammonia-lyase
MNRLYLNPAARERHHAGLFSEDDYARVTHFYDGQATLTATPLHHLPALAAALGIGEVMVKDESSRLGLPAFKIMGVWYAINELLSAGAVKSETKLVCATSGNHGRAVARAARLVGLAARVYVPHDALPSRLEAIAGEGAEVIISDGGYNDAVRQAAADAEAHGWKVISDDAKADEWKIISDTSYSGYEEIPRLIMAGYTRLIDEASKQWNAPPEIVLVQGGVGGLVCGVASWWAYYAGARRPYFICCEPTGAACLLESARAGGPVALEGELTTKMEGLRCSEVSEVAWPAIAATVDAFVAIDDEWSFRTMRRLAHPSGGDPQIVAGASGACGLAALTALLEDDALRDLREASGADLHSRALVFNTEGATDPELYQRVTGE